MVKYSPTPSHECRGISGANETVCNWLQDACINTFWIDRWQTSLYCPRAWFSINILVLKLRRRLILHHAFMTTWLYSQNPMKVYLISGSKMGPIYWQRWHSAVYITRSCFCRQAYPRSWSEWGICGSCIKSIIIMVYWYYNWAIKHISLPN